jgi:hypothetical protein
MDGAEVLVTSIYQQFQILTVCFSREGGCAVKSWIGTKWRTFFKRWGGIVECALGVELVQSTRTSRGVMMDVPYQTLAILSSGNAARP